MLLLTNYVAVLYRFAFNFFLILYKCMQMFILYQYYYTLNSHLLLSITFC